MNVASVLSASVMPEKLRCRAAVCDAGQRAPGITCMNTRTGIRRIRGLCTLAAPLRLAACLSAAATIACSSAPTVGAPDGNTVGNGATTISVMNDGAVALTSVKVLTSDKDSVLIATLSAGQSAGPYTVSAMHTN